MPVNRVITGIHHPAGKPSIKRRGIIIENFVPFFVPADPLRCFSPEIVRLFKTSPKNIFISCHDPSFLLPVIKCVKQVVLPITFKPIALMFSFVKNGAKEGGLCLFSRRRDSGKGQGKLRVL
jgi:hypothetical protein